MGPYLGTPNTEKDSEDGQNDQMKYGATSMQGWRKSQEDSHIASFLNDGNSVFGVFDGHGGKEVSIFVKARFCKELQKLPSYEAKDYEKALKECFKKMDDILLSDEGEKDLKKIQSLEGGAPDPFSSAMPDENSSIAQYVGCTATVILITKNDIYCANAGDSRTVLGRTSGTMCCELSEDHKPENAPERARIEAAGGFVEENRVNGSLNLSRSMGDFEYKSKKDLGYLEQMVIVDPEVKKVARQQNDQFIMLACDGIWDCVTSEEGIERMRGALATRKSKISTCIEELFDSILAKDILSSGGIGTDNMTCIVVELAQK